MNAKSEALKKKKGKCEECGSEKHSTKRHKEYEGSKKDEEKDKEEIDG